MFNGKPIRHMNPSTPTSDQYQISPGKRTQMKDDYTTNSHYLLKRLSLKDWENVLFELEGEPSFQWEMKIIILPHNQ